MTGVKKRYVLPKKNFSGWSNTHFGRSYVAYPLTAEEVRSIVKGAKISQKTIIGRGAGQSYGDQSLNHDQIVLDLSRMNKILGWDKTTGILQVETGAIYEDVLIHCLKDNWIPAVIPGTRYVTMGGALANNVHGKNSYSRGNFGNWVKEFKLVLASGDQLTCSKEINPDLFYGTIGGAGLLGIVTEITLQLVSIPSPHLTVKRSTAPSLLELMDNLDKESKKNELVIAQVDCFPNGKILGRGTIHAADFGANDSGTNINDLAKIHLKIFGLMPKKWLLAIGKYTMSDFVMSIISRTKYYFDKITSSENPHMQNVFRFMFLLDQVPNWKRIFKNGFFEYEPLIPTEKARIVIPQLIALTHQYRMPAYLSAIKIHKQDDFLLSYSMNGYSFAMDIPRHSKKKEEQNELFKKMNEIVIGAGGIVYLAKDATLTPDEFRQMYDVEKFLEIKKKYDPDELFQSDMYRRIFKKPVKTKEKMEMKKELLTLDKALTLGQAETNELYKKHVNAGLLGIYEILGVADMDIASAEGVEIKLKDGRTILDFTSAIGILNLGHNHPKILAAEAKCQNLKLVNAIKIGPGRLHSALSYDIAALLPDPLSVSFLTTSGAEAVEAAMKLCERVQGQERTKFITTTNAYHGKTHTAISLTRSGHIRDGFIQGISEENVIAIPYGDTEALSSYLQKEANKVIAFIVEPIQGQSIETPRDGYLKSVVEICHKNNVLVIFDEVKSGVSRTGTFCAFQNEEVVPNVVTLSKSLGGGSRAIGAMVTSEELFKKAYGKKKWSGLHTTTFGGLGYTCAVAIEALNILGDPDFQKSVQEKGEYLKKKLLKLQAKYPNQIVAIKGRGLMQAIQFNFRNVFQSIKLEIPPIPLIETYDTAMMAALIRTLYEKYNIIAHFSDSNLDTLHVMPPLICEKHHLDTFVNAIDQILQDGLLPLALNFTKKVLRDKFL